MTTLSDLTLKQLTTAYGVLAQVEVQAKTFNGKTRAIARLEALMADNTLTLADVLKAAGVEDETTAEPAADAPMPEPAPEAEPAAPLPEPVAEAPETKAEPERPARRDAARLTAEALRPLAWLDIEHLAERADGSIVFAVNDTTITVGDVRRARAALAALPSRSAGRARPGTPRQPRTGTKQETILALLRRPQGATIAEIADTAGGWQSHSVRGFLAGLKKKGFTVTSEKPEGATERLYKLPA